MSSSPPPSSCGCLYNASRTFQIEAAGTVIGIGFATLPGSQEEGRTGGIHDKGLRSAQPGISLLKSGLEGDARRAGSPTVQASVAEGPGRSPVWSRTG